MRNSLSLINRQKKEEESNESPKNTPINNEQATGTT